MNALDILRSDHHRMTEFFSRAEGMVSPEERRSLLAPIKELMESHSIAEEQIFYPYLATRSALGDKVEAAAVDHEDARRIMMELERAAPDREFNRKFDRLMDSIQAHMAEEEGQLFPLAERLFSAEELDDLGMEMQAARVVSVKVAA